MTYRRVASSFLVLSACTSHPHPVRYANNQAMTVPDNSLLPTLLAALRARQQITLVLAPDLGRRCGVTDLHDSVVFLDARNDDGAMHATLVHELLHLVCPDCPDDEVEAQTAEALVPLDEALTARATGDIAGVAARLRVDEQLIRARLRTIPASEDQVG